MRPTLRTIANQPSWVIRSRNVELAITQLGGHMAPVTFYRTARRPIRPYYLNPWHGEGLKIDAEVLRPLRGDFFCMPFGANAAPYRDEAHAVHGETACRRWRLAAAARSGGVTSLTLSMRTKVRPGKVTKLLSLVDGQNVVYVRHELEGFSGLMPVGHHAILAMPEAPESVLLATSPTRFGATNPAPPGLPAEGEYYSVAPGRRFRSLTRVPLIWKDQPFGDCTRLPTRAGFTDILGVVSRPTAMPAWTAATYVKDRFLWFSLKDPSVLPMTLMWVSNRGRHGAPWNGRNCCLGLEDICGFFADGLAASAQPNALSDAGVPTAVRLSPGKPTAIHSIQGVVRVPRGFRRVAEAVFTPGGVTFVSEEGAKAATAVRHEFLQDGDPTGG